MSKARTLANFVSAGNPLADGAIAASEVTGLATVATSGSYADLSNTPTTIGTANDLSGGAIGSIPYQAGTGDTAMLAAGAAGKVLTSNGAAAPSWETAASSSYRSVLNQSSDITLTTADGGGFINVSGTLDLNLNLPAANALTNRTIYIKNVGNYVMFTYDNAGNYLFTLNPDVTVAMWASDNSSAAGQWTVQEAPPPYIAPTSNIASGAISYALGNKPVAKISSTQQIMVFNRSTTIQENPYALIITQSSGTLSYGTPYLLANEEAGGVSVSMVSATTGVATWSNALGLRGCVITVSGTTITAGTPISIYSSSALYGYNQTDALSSTTLICAFHATSSNIKSCVLTISGTTLSTGTVVDVVTDAEGYRPFLGALSSSSSVISYCRTDGNSYVRTLGVSGSTVTVNTSYTLETGTSTTDIRGCVISSSKVAVVYNNSGNGIFEIKCVNISGTTCTPATKQSFATGTYSYHFDIGAMTSSSGIVFYYNASALYSYRAWTLSGNTFTFGSVVAAPSSYNSYAYPTLVGYADPAVGSVNSSTYMLSMGFKNGMNFQTLTLSGTTITQTSIEYGIATYYEINPSYAVDGSCAFSSTKSLYLIGSYIGGGVGSGLNILLVDSTNSTPSLLQSLNITTSFSGDYCSIAAISSTQAVVIYCNSSAQLISNVITLSGSTISVGSPTTITTAAATWPNITNLTSTSAIVCWMESGAFNSVVLTVSGSTVTVNSTLTINTATAIEIQVVALSSTKALVTYGQSGPKANVLTISGTTITAGNQQVINGGLQNKAYLLAISSTKCLYCSGSSTSGGTSYANILNISGDIVSTAQGSSLPAYYGGIKFALTGANKGIALLRSMGLMYSFSISNDIVNFSNQSSTIGKHITLLASPNVASPSGNKVIVFGYDGVNFWPNTIYASGAIN